MYTWMQGNSFSQIATIYSGNITLNTPCIEFFEGVKWCVIGIDKDSKKVAIKPVTESETKENKFQLNTLNKVSIGKSYIRISNKNVVKEISKLVKKKSENEKYNIDYNEKEKLLVIDLNNPI